MDPSEGLSLTELIFLLGQHSCSLFLSIEKKSKKKHKKSLGVSWQHGFHHFKSFVDDLWF